MSLKPTYEKFECRPKEIAAKAVEPNRTERGQREPEGSFFAKKSVALIAGILILFGLYVKENPVDLIVLDMVMPKGINGRKTYQQIIKIRPGQKAVIASGYAKTKEVDIAQELGAGKYIAVPGTPYLIIDKSQRI